MKPKLYVLTGGASHFARWEMPLWSAYFNVVDQPREDAALMAFGPDVIQEGLLAPARRRFITTFPGFGENPLHDLQTRARHVAALARYDKVFINTGPLELAYASLANVVYYPFSVDVDSVPFRQRERLASLLHASSDSPQKDWQRSLEVMRMSGLKYEVYPRRVDGTLDRQFIRVASRLRGILGLHRPLHSGYGDHKKLHAKMLKYDGFVHSARDVRHRHQIDGKYTATLIEAGLSGAILFWHDTFALGNEYETVFPVPLDPVAAAELIVEVGKSVDIARHSRRTREELAEKYSVERSVAVRAKLMLEEEAT